MAEKKDAKPKRGRPRKHQDADEGGRTGVPVNFRMDPTLHSLIPAYRAKFFAEHNVRLSMTDVMEKALRLLYREAGMDVPDPPFDT